VSEDDPFGHLADRAAANWETVMAGFPPAPDSPPGTFGNLALNVVFGSVWDRPHLDVRDRRLITLTAMAALGRNEVTVVHVRAALHSGDITPDQLREMIVQVIFYLGFPLTFSFNQIVQEEIAAFEAQSSEQSPG
jgi:4-carboxymuconolactone decarboxylase